MEVLVKHCKSPKFLKVGDNKYRMQEGDTIMGHIDGARKIDPDVRAQAIPKLGLDAQVISTPLPGAERFEKSMTVETQELINNELQRRARIPKVMPRFPLQSVLEGCGCVLEGNEAGKGDGSCRHSMPLQRARPSDQRP